MGNLGNIYGITREAGHETLLAIQKLDRRLSETEGVFEQIFRNQTVQTEFIQVISASLVPTVVIKQINPAVDYLHLENTSGAVVGGIDESGGRLFLGTSAPAASDGESDSDYALTFIAPAIVGREGFWKFSVSDVTFANDYFAFLNNTSVANSFTPAFVARSTSSNGALTFVYDTSGAWSALGNVDGGIEFQVRRGVNTEETSLNRPAFSFNNNEKMLTSVSVDGSWTFYERSSAPSPTFGGAGYLQIADTASAAGQVAMGVRMSSTGLNGVGGAILGTMVAGNDSATADLAAVILEGRRESDVALTGADILCVRNFGTTLARCAFSGAWTFQPFTGQTTVTPITAKGLASQTGNLFQAQSSAAVNLLFIGSDGHLGMRELASDPAALADNGKFYTKDVATVTQGFYRASDGTITQLSGAGGTTITGGGTTNKIPKWTAATVLGDSNATDDGTTVTFSIETVHNGGVDVGTLGRFDSNVVNAIGAFNFLFKPTTTLTSGVDRGIFSVQKSDGTQAFRVYASGNIEVGSAGGTTGGLFTAAGVVAENLGLNFSPSSMTGSGASVFAQAQTVAGGSFTASAPATPAALNYVGSIFSTKHQSTQTANITSEWGAWFRASDATPGSNSTRVWTDMGGWKVFSTPSNMNAGTVTNWYGGLIQDASDGTTFVMNNTYGLRINEQTRGTVIKNGIFLDQAAAGYKALAIRDQNAWINSEVASELDLNAATAVDVNIGGLPIGRWLTSGLIVDNTATGGFAVTLKGTGTLGNEQIRLDAGGAGLSFLDIGVDGTTSNVTSSNTKIQLKSGATSGNSYELLDDGGNTQLSLRRSDGLATFRGGIVPATTGAGDLGSSSAGWSSLFLKDTAANIEVKIQVADATISADRTLTIDLRNANRTLSFLKQTYTETNVTTDRAFDANATTLDEIADVLGTLIQDLRAAGIAVA
jgi:hypothetical protein